MAADFSKFTSHKYFTVGVLAVYLCKKVLGNIRYLHGLRLGLGIGSGLVPSYYPVILIAIIST